jgi:hypothetical protein
MHCENCGASVTCDTDGTLVHKASPPGFDPQACVTGVSGGSPLGTGFIAVACPDADCPDEPDVPWWVRFVKGGA